MNRDFDLEAIRRELVAPEDLSRHLLIGLYGRPGSGKTTFCASAGKVKNGKPNTLIIDTESGVRSIRGAPGVKVFRVRQWIDIERIWHLLMATDDMDGFEDGVIAIDTLSSLLKMAISYIAGDHKVDMTRLITEASSKVTLPEYGDAARKLGEIMNKFALLRDRATIIFTLHQRRGENISDAAEVIPDLTAAAYREFITIPDLLGYMTARTEVDLLGNAKEEGFTNRLILKPSEKLESKDRISGKWVDPSAMLPKEIINPNLAEILKEYRKGIKRAAPASA